MHLRVALLLSFALGCSSSSPPASPPEDSGTADARPTIAWEPCALHSEGDGPAAECATLAMPLRRNDPDGEKIDYFVKRYRPGKGLRALWLLQGGPGGSGYAFERIAEQLAASMPDVDFYIPDHRGTGRSSRVGCPKQERAASLAGIFIAPTEWAGCLASVQAEWGDRLKAFTTTEAAHDLGTAIERTAKPGVPVFVMGASYGTYLAHRYVQLFPNQAAGVIFDSIVPGSGQSLARQDEDADEAGRAFFAACGKDALCSAKLGPDPRARALALFEKLDAGHCPDLGAAGLLGREALRRAFGQMMMSFSMRTFIPPAIYRAERCSPADVTALNKLLSIYFAPSKTPSPFYTQWGWVLSNNITFSELWESPSPTAEDLQKIRAEAIVSRDVTAAMDALIGKWPTYPTDELMGNWAVSDVPMLGLSGGLDPATLPRRSKAFADHFHGPHQHFVSIETATHTVIASSPMSDLKHSCGSRILKGFIENPTGPLDEACLSDLAPLDFAGRPDLTTSILGTTDPWE